MEFREVLKSALFSGTRGILRDEFLDIFGVADDCIERAFRRLRVELQHLLAADVVLEFDLDPVRLLEFTDDRLLS